MTELFKARWTNRIHDEWTFNLLRNRPDLTIDRLQKTRRLMNFAIRDCLVEGYETLIPFLELPDQDDRHVLAAAIHSGASVIVTFNLKDFQKKFLNKHKIRALHPDDFILSLLDLDAVAVLQAARQHRARLTNPIKSAKEYLFTLSHQGLVKTALYLHTHIGSI
jgi:predicted nucleic acid-binding protein